MDLRILEENKERIIKEFSEELNNGDARHIRYEINWILSKADNNSWVTLEDAYRERISTKPYSNITKSNKKYYFRCICKKLYPGPVFMPRVYSHCEDPDDMLKTSKGYGELNHGYRDLLDTYVFLAKKAGKKWDTIFIHCSLTAKFLRHLQDKGANSLEEAAEACVMSFFYADSQYEQQLRSYSYKEKLAVVFKTCMTVDEYTTGCRHVLNMIPAFGYVRKNVEYLTASEAEAIRDSIDSEQLSRRDRAIMMILLYTGMRSCDVASIKLRDIDWKSETISIVQKKTAEPLVLAMMPAVGNAVFEYLCDSGVESPSGYLFCEAGNGRNHIPAKR
ncbi:MAG: tyrosine-type recombinase/integrase [Eubacteriales bacterium]|nr:tyrosine-type recombinase/integrase [Eubacteriales bacterium]